MSAHILNLLIIIIGIILLFGNMCFSIAISRGEVRNDGNHWYIFILSAVGTTLITLGTARETNLGNPTALNVYQGKTTIEVTYRDSVAVDSVVVFKNKEE